MILGVGLLGIPYTFRLIATLVAFCVGTLTSILVTRPKQGRPCTLVYSGTFTKSPSRSIPFQDITSHFLVIVPLALWLALAR